jgi:hypothetical protein
MSAIQKTTRLHGLMAEFKTPEDLLAAAHKTYAAGYRDMDAYTPIPVEGLGDAIGFKKNYVSLAVLLGGLTGCSGGFGLLYWISTIAYAHNVAGRPMNSWVMYIPVTFECTVLLAALTAVFGMFAMNGLPQPYHPVFNVPEFARATRDRFFLCVEATDPQFDAERTKEFLRELSSFEVAEVEN